MIQKICIADAMKLLKPIENDQVAIEMFDHSYQIITDQEICEMKRCSARTIKNMKDVIDLLRKI
jgi:hypothetical protein